jgi:nucleoside-diphosphate-sugar epimerase
MNGERLRLCNGTAVELVDVGGGVPVTIGEGVAQACSISGPITVARRSPTTGDERHTGADTRVAARAFGYRRRTPVAEGRRAMVEWDRSRPGVPA